MIKIKRTYSDGRFIETRLVDLSGKGRAYNLNGSTIVELNFRPHVCYVEGTINGSKLEIEDVDEN